MRSCLTLGVYRVFEEGGKKEKRKRRKKKIHVGVVSRLVTFYRLYRRKIKLMERREEGGLTETGKEKARSEEERVTCAKARDSFETCAPILLSDDKKKRGVKREHIEGCFASLHFTDLFNLDESRLISFRGFGCKLLAEIRQVRWV